MNSAYAAFETAADPGRNRARYSAGGLCRDMHVLAWAVRWGRTVGGIDISGSIPALSSFPPGATLLALRAAAGFTVRDVADLLCVERLVVEGWESGTLTPAAEQCPVRQGDRLLPAKRL